MMNRIEAKSNAKALLRGKPAMECLLFFVILLGITVLPTCLNWKFSPLSSLPSYILNGDLEWWIWELMDMELITLTMPLCIGMIQALVELLFKAGLIRCALRLCQGDQTVQAADTLKAFDKLWKYICISLFQKLLFGLWNLPATALIAAAYLVLAHGLANFSMGQLIASVVLLLLAGIWSVFITINKSLQYFYAYYVCEDNPELGAVACVRRSGELTAGHKPDLFVVWLSFIGWDLLDSLFIPRVFTIPYRYLTYAGIYRQLSGAEDDLRQPAVRPAEPIQPTAAAAGSAPAIEFISGEYAGMRAPVQDGVEIRIGRDLRQVQLVVSQDNGRVSGLHCGVRYDRASDRYFVTDYSSNGTYAEGVRLPAGSTPVRRGAVIKLADAVLLRLA